ncbi:hypothetical protein IE53DRAFT_198052 [Violaceomyces palustris]|uniref:Uncharacterized protein n=1 Tax=Violaceomyces palustris TaxID=1673888 RepID=A0ACD0NRH7_9BASI|nr:hypothetical protein IE53DRAFT_198052 [Violaceomyces palustris]
MTARTTRRLFPSLQAHSIYHGRRMRNSFSRGNRRLEAYKPEMEERKHQLREKVAFYKKGEECFDPYKLMMMASRDRKHIKWKGKEENLRRFGRMES